VFVSFEGIDGAGKSTQARLLAERLGPETLLLREPGGTPAGERLRELLKDPELELGPRAELLLFCAARAELVERVIRPALEAGRDVVCDRFMDSTVAYQGAARGLGVETVRTLNEIAVDGCVPDRTILLRVPTAEAADRGAGRGGFGDDRFEREGESFQATIARAFDELAAAEAARIVAIDGGGLAEDVHLAICTALGIDAAGAAGETEAPGR
jgi:dTMP kinase